MSIFTIKHEGGYCMLLRGEKLIALFTENADRETQDAVVAALNNHEILKRPPLEGGKTEEEATTLWDREGIIYVDRDGGWFTNQTGGCCCHHPTARGRFVDHALPEELKSLWGVWGRASVEQDEECGQIFAAYNLPWKVRTMFFNEEAWVHVEIDGKPAILTWQNSD